MTGSYTINNTAADFDEIYKGGGGTLTAGRLEGSLSGDTFSGYWYETAGEGGYGSVQRTCDPAKAGVLVYGRFSFTFSADRKTFTGTMSTCEDEVKGATEWNGTLTRRGQP